MKFIFILILFPGFLCAQTADDIVDRYLDTVSNGNVENWSKIRSAYMESYVYYSEKGFEQSGSDFLPSKPKFEKYYFLAPDKRKIETYTDSTSSSLLSSFYFSGDKRVIIIGNMPPMIKPASPQDKSFHIGSPMAFYSFIKKSKSQTFNGIKDLMQNGLQYYEVEVQGRHELVRYYFNTETFLLEYTVKDDIYTKYSDYKKVNDYLIPFTQIKIRNGNPYYWNVYKTIEFNVDIDPRKFNNKY